MVAICVSIIFLLLYLLKRPPPPLEPRFGTEFRRPPITNSVRHHIRIHDVALPFARLVNVDAQRAFRLRRQRERERRPAFGLVRWFSREVRRGGRAIGRNDRVRAQSLPIPAVSGAIRLL